MQQIKPGERCFQLFQINWVAQAESCVAPLLPAAAAWWWHGGGITSVQGTLPLPSPSAESQTNPSHRPGSPPHSTVWKWQTFGVLFQSIKPRFYYFFFLAAEDEEVSYNAPPHQCISIITIFNAFRCGEAGSGIRSIFKERAFYL